MIDLEDLIRQGIKNSDSADPREIAQDVVASMTAKQLKEAAEIMMPAKVNEMLRNYRRRHPFKGLPTKSPRWEQATQDYWQEVLMRRESLAPNEWKFLKDCTRADLLVIAQNRRELADSHIAIAEQYEAMARTMDKLNVSKVGDLGPEYLEKIA